MSKRTLAVFMLPTNHQITIDQIKRGGVIRELPLLF
jgi:hypothetical protein